MGVSHDLVPFAFKARIPFFDQLNLVLKTFYHKSFTRLRRLTNRIFSSAPRISLQQQPAFYCCCIISAQELERAPIMAIRIIALKNWNSHDTILQQPPFGSRLLKTIPEDFSYWSFDVFKWLPLLLYRRRRYTSKGSWKGWSKQIQKSRCNRSTIFAALNDG